MCVSVPSFVSNCSPPKRVLLLDDFSSPNIKNSLLTNLQFLKLEIDYRAVANYEHYEMK